MTTQPKTDTKRIIIRALIFATIVSVFAFNGYDNMFNALVYVFFTTTIYISFVIMLDKKRAKNQLKNDKKQIEQEPTQQTEQDKTDKQS